MRRANTMLIVVLAGVVLLVSQNVRAAPLDRIELEIAAERSVDASLQRQWFERIKRLGVRGLRLRQARSTESPTITARSGTPSRYKVVALLSPGDRLHLPGRSFTGRDTGALRRYLTMLVEQGVDGVTATRGAFGLTKKQFERIYADLSQPIGFETKGKPLADVIEQMERVLKLPIAIDASAGSKLQRGKAADDVSDFSVGTGLAILLRSERLALKPVVENGKPTHRVDLAPLASGSSGKNAVSDDNWPVGYKPERRLSQVVPVLLESITVRIEGRTLAEALDALQERVHVPFLIDHAALSAEQIDVAAVKVRFPARRASHKRILDNILFQGKLQGEVRVDEAGRVFYWITTARKP